MSHELRAEFAPLVDEKLRDTLVTIDEGDSGVLVFNTKYEGDASAGAVKIPLTSKMTVRPYDKANGIAPTTGSTTYVTVTDFNDVAINEVVDGYDEAALTFDIIADRLSEAGIAGAESMDKTGIVTLELGGSTGEDNSLTTIQTAFNKLVVARTLLTKAGVPTSGRYAIVSPDFYALLLQDTTNFIKQGDISQEMVNDGYIGMCAGFAIKESQNVAPNTEFIAGHSNFATRVKTWIRTPDTVDLNGSGNYVGASAVQGRWVYKEKVTNGNGIYVKSNFPSMAPMATTPGAGQIAITDIFPPTGTVAKIGYIKNADFSVEKALSDGETFTDTTYTLPHTVTGLVAGDQLAVYALDASNNVLGLGFAAL